MEVLNVHELELEADPVQIKILRWVVSGGKARSQVSPNNAFNPDAQKPRAG